MVWVEVCMPVLDEGAIHGIECCGSCNRVTDLTLASTGVVER